MILNLIGRYSTSYQPSSGSEPSFAFSAINQYVMVVFTAEKNMTITQFGMCVNNASGTPPVRIAMWQYTVGFNPSTTTKTYTDANPITVSTVSTPTFIWWNLTTPQSIIRGNTYAIGLESYGTWSGNLSVVQTHQQGKRDYSQISGQPFSMTSSSGATLPFRFGIASATETYGWPVSTSGTEDISNFIPTSGLLGNSFIIPTTMGATCSLQGALAAIQINQAFVTSDLRLYNATSYPPTLIASRTIANGGNPSSTVNALYWSSGGQIYFPFTTPQTLTCGVKYLVGIYSSGDIHNIGKLTFARAQDADCLSDVQSYGVSFRGSTWTETGLTRYAILPDVTDFVAATGSSGGGPVVGGRLVN